MALQVPQLSYFGTSNNSNSIEIHRFISKPTFSLLFTLGFGSTLVKPQFLLSNTLGRQAINPNCINDNSWSNDINNHTGFGLIRRFIGQTSKDTRTPYNENASKLKATQVKRVYNQSITTSFILNPRN